MAPSVPSADPAAVVSSPASADAGPSTCADAGPVDVNVTYANVTEHHIGAMLDLHVVAPRAKINESFATIAPASCTTSSTGPTLSWRCGSVFGNVSVASEKGTSWLVFRSDYDSNNTGRVRTTRSQAAWPCGARPVFHPKDFRAPDDR
ncbi:MAG: hypothetical protein ABIP39_00460 [Polyangiaceae bacterium]